MSCRLICPYCKRNPVLTKGVEIYPRRPDLAEKLFWRCEPCDAYVGVHEGTVNALGRLANKELRVCKQQAHKVFDPLWQKKMVRDGISKSKARKAGYKWLANQLDIDVKDCHIGMFDVETCNQVIAICRSLNKRD